MTEQEIMTMIQDETKLSISTSETNPAGYRDENYNAAYGECFGDDVISDETEAVFDTVIEKIWRD